MDNSGFAPIPDKLVTCRSGSHCFASPDVNIYTTRG